MATQEELKKLFADPQGFKEVEFLKAPHYKSILSQPIGSSIVKYAGTGSDRRFEDLETRTYFYDFSEACPHLRFGDANRFVVDVAEWDSDQTVGEKLECLRKDDVKVTHVMRSTEEYASDGDSGRRVYLTAQVYELEQKARRIVVVSGPSGVGKGPLIEAVKKLYVPDLCQVKVKKAPGERHRSDDPDLILKEDQRKCFKFPCRGTEQRIYYDELDSALDQNEIVLIEAYYEALGFLKKQYGDSAEVVSTFISPLDLEEVKMLDGRLRDYLPDRMLDSLVTRAKQDGKAITRKLLTDLKQRADDSVTELKFARFYDLVIPNHCHESDSRWKFSELVEEPRKVVLALRDIINEGTTSYGFKGRDLEFLAGSKD